MMDSGGGTGSLAITTERECAWDASASVSWISSLSPASGQGTANVSFQVASNDDASSREGMIVVNGEQARVSQRAPCRYEVGPSSHSVAPGGGTGNLTITATDSVCAWAAAADVGWISLMSAAGSGSGTVAFAVSLNDGAQRTGSITVANQRSVVTQASGSRPSPPPPSPPSPSPPPPNPCTYSLSPTTQKVSANDGAGSVGVLATPSSCSWTAASNDSWLTVSSGASGTGNGTVTYRYLLNLGGVRTATLTIAGRTFTVIQAALPPIQ
jgi:hypothetical protein